MFARPLPSQMDRFQCTADLGVYLIRTPGVCVQCEADANGGDGGPRTDSIPYTLNDTQPLSSVNFRVQHRVAWGEVLKVVGDSQALGDWVTASAPSASMSNDVAPINNNNMVVA